MKCNCGARMRVAYTRPISEPPEKAFIERTYVCKQCGDTKKTFEEEIINGDSKGKKDQLCRVR